MTVEAIAGGFFWFVVGINAGWILAFYLLFGRRPTGYSPRGAPVNPIPPGKRK